MHLILAQGELRFRSDQGVYQLIQIQFVGVGIQVVLLEEGGGGVVRRAVVVFVGSGSGCVGGLCCLVYLVKFSGQSFCGHALLGQFNMEWRVWNALNAISHVL